MLIGADVTRSAGPLNNVTVTGATTMADTRHEVSIARADDASFEDLGRRTQLAYRDLGVRAATGGRYHAHIMRTSGTGERKIARHVHALELQMVYILKGWVKIWFEGRGEVTLKEGDCCVTPGGVPHEVLDWSDDHEVLEITSPADYETTDAPAG